MLQQRFVGGVLFDGDRVLLLHNEKREWVLPKGQVGRDSDPAVALHELFLHRLSLKTCQRGEAVAETSYERYSVARKRPVQVNIVWNILAVDPSQTRVNLRLEEHSGYDEALFVPMEEALKHLTYPAENNVLLKAYQQLQAEIRNED